MSSHHERAGHSSDPTERREISRVALLVNPASGHGAGARVAAHAAEALRRRGVHVVVLSGVSAGESRALARGAVHGVDDDGPADALVVCGGDGLISLAVQEQGGSGVPLGIIPAGTGNDLARDLGMDGMGVEEAVDVVCAGRVQAADLGLVCAADGQERRFATVLCAGFDSTTNSRVNSMRWPHGAARYVVGAALTLPAYRPRRVRMVFDDDEAGAVEASVFSAAFGITQYYGGGLRVCPEADRGDGLFDVTWIGDVTRLRGVWEFRRMFSGGHVGRPGVFTRRCRSVRLSAVGGGAGGGATAGSARGAAAALEAFADGDLVSPLPVSAEVISGAALYLVP